MVLKTLHGFVQASGNVPAKNAGVKQHGRGTLTKMYIGNTSAFMGLEHGPFVISRIQGHQGEGVQLEYLHQGAQLAFSIPVP